MNAYKYDGDPLKIYYSEDYDGMSDPNEFDWVDITSHFTWSPGEYEWATTDYTLTNMQDVHNLYVAFKYTSTETAAATWEVADFHIYTGYDAVNENEAVKFDLYPNPATSVVMLNAEQAAEAQIMDMAGRMVMVVNVNEGENAINVAELSNGVYFVKMNGTVVKFIKR